MVHRFIGLRWRIWRNLSFTSWHFLFAQFCDIISISSWNFDHMVLQLRLSNSKNRITNNSRPVSNSITIWHKHNKVLKWPSLPEFTLYWRSGVNMHTSVMTGMCLTFFPSSLLWGRLRKKETIMQISYMHACGCYTYFLQHNGYKSLNNNSVVSFDSLYL